MDVGLKSDVEKLEDAIRTANTNKDALHSVFEILCVKKFDQRNAIISESECNGNVRERLEKLKLNKNIFTCIVALITPPIEFYADKLYYAFRNRIADTIIHILCPLSNEELTQLKAQYEKKYNTTLEEEIRHYSKEHLRQLVLKLCECNRLTDSRHVSLIDDVKALASEKDPYDDETNSCFPEIFAKRSFQNIRHISEKFETLQQKSLVDHVKKKFKISEDRNGYKAILMFSEDQIEYNKRCIKLGQKSKNGTLIGIGLIRNADLLSVSNMNEDNYLRNLIRDIMRL